MAANRWTLPILTCLIDWFILSPIQFYSIIRFVCNPCIHQNRYPSLLKWINVIIFILVSIWHPLIVISQLSPINTISPLIFQLSATISFCLFAIIHHTMCVLVGSRYWSMFYDLNFLNSNINNQWKLFIDPNLFNPSFWLNYKSTLGNHTFIFKSLSCIFSFTCFIHCVLIIIYNDIQYIPHWNAAKEILFIIPILTELTLYFKSPDIPNNKLWLKYELLAVMIIPICVFISVVPFNMYILWMYDEYQGINNQQNMEGIYNALTIIEMAPIAMVLTYIPTWWVPKHFSSNISKKRYHKLSNTSSNDILVCNYSLYQILSDENLINGFIAHFCVDSNVAIITCFIEMVQFKDLIQKTFNISIDRMNNRLSTIDEDHDEQHDDQNQELYIFSECLLCSNEAIPKSNIVYKLNQHRSIKDFLHIIHVLYYKYIHSEDGVIEEHNKKCCKVKLSPTLRNCYKMDINMSLDAFIDIEINQRGVKPTDLFEYFDLVIAEMWNSLQSAVHSYQPAKE